MEVDLEFLGHCQYLVSFTSTRFELQSIDTHLRCSRRVLMSLGNPLYMEALRPAWPRQR